MIRAYGSENEMTSSTGDNHDGRGGGGKEVKVEMSRTSKRQVEDPSGLGMENSCGRESPIPPLRKHPYASPDVQSIRYRGH